MKVSLKIIQKLVDVDIPPIDELVNRINGQLGGVEEVIDFGKKYQDAIVVKVVSVEKHPDADRLSVCLIDDNGAVGDVERNGNGHVQVVCGAPNVHADMWAVWLPPKATVPASYDDAEPFVLDSRKLRGVMSSGMLAAGDELAINSDHDGIVELTERDLPKGRTLQAGASFMDLFDLDDVVIDIENKMFTHRPDCFGQIGVAREISAILRGVPEETEEIFDMGFVNPDWYWMKPSFESANGLELKVVNQSPDKVPRFMTVAMKDCRVEPSPLWLQCELMRLGSKPINNIVDITNYIMLMTAQPTHAYDYDKLRGKEISARMARDDEEISLLNGKTYKLTADDIVIADAEGPVGLAGIMGGSDSEVSSETKNIVIEVATFDMYAVRKTAMRHGVFTDALARFNKGQSPLQNDRVLARLMTMVQDLTGAQQASDVYDLPDKTGQLDEVSLSGEMRITTDFINSRLGSNLTVFEIGGLLRRTNFASYPAEDDNQTLIIGAPFWRTDIVDPEDVVEEVGRLYGFDRLPCELPLRVMSPAPRNESRSFKQQVRDSLSRAGANELLTYSFVHENIMKRAEQDVSRAFRLSNALSPDLQYYRLSILPSLLDKVNMNIKLGYDEFTLFEIGKAHDKRDHATDDNGLPSEIEMIDAVYANKRPQSGSPYFRVRRLVMRLAQDLGITLKTAPIEETLDDPFVAPFEQSRSALVKTCDGKSVGIVGELKASVRKSFKLPEYSSAMSLDLQALKKASEEKSEQYRPLSRYPSISQDVTLKSRVDVAYESLLDTTRTSLAERAEEINITIDPVSIYQSLDDADHKSTTLHITFTHPDRTLTDADIKPLMDHLACVMLSKYDAERV